MENNIFERDFQTHLFIEFYYRKPLHGTLLEHLNSENYNKILLEQYGVFDGCYDLAKQIAEEIPSLSKKEEIFVTFKDNKFVNKVKLISDSSIDVMAYDPDETFFNKHFNILKLVIRVNPNCINNEDIIPLIMHELTHAYQDAEMYKRGDRLFYQLERENYYGSQEGNDTELRKIIADIIYYSNNFERGAYIAQIAGMLQVDGIKIGSISDAYKYIRNTQVYKDYIQVLMNIQKLININDEKDKQLILSEFNKVALRKYKSFSDVARWLRHRASNIKKKFEKTIPKVIFDNVEFKHCVK